MAEAVLRNAEATHAGAYKFVEAGIDPSFRAALRCTPLLAAHTEGDR